MKAYSSNWRNNDACAFTLATMSLSPLDPVYMVYELESDVKFFAALLCILYIINRNKAPTSYRGQVNQARVGAWQRATCPVAVKTATRGGGIMHNSGIIKLANAHSPNTAPHPSLRAAATHFPPLYYHLG